MIYLIFFKLTISCILRLLSRAIYCRIQYVTYIKYKKLRYNLYLQHNFRFCGYKNIAKFFNFSPKSSPFILSTYGCYCPKEIGYVQFYRYIKIILMIYTYSLRILFLVSPNKTELGGNFNLIYITN